MPKEPRPLQPVDVGPLNGAGVRPVGFQHQTASSPALIDISFTVSAR